MKYSILFSRQYEKSIKRLSDRIPMEKLHEVVNCLSRGERLPDSARDHKLRGDMQDYRQCHVKGDLILQYKRNEALKVISITDIGTHHELLGR